jgi:signal transduction histidine kinase
VGFARQLQHAPVLADPGRLHQVITNLLSNALKFTPPRGHVQMSVSAADGQARLEVSDTGPGISREDQTRVFERWWRATGAARTPGSGIGLAVAAQLVRAHQGTIEVTSQPGSGSRFTVTYRWRPMPLLRRPLSCLCHPTGRYSQVRQRRNCRLVSAA